MDEIERKYLFFSDKLTLIDEFYVLQCHKRVVRYKIMKLLEEKIRSEGKALSETVLKVDGFINHQVDPVLMSEIGKTLASYYKDKGVT